MFRRIFLVVIAYLWRFYRFIFHSLVFNITKRLGLGYVNGNGAFHVSQDVAETGISLYLLVVYLVIMFTVTLHILLPKMFRENHEKIFKTVRYCNIAIIIVFAIGDCIEQGRLVEASIVGVIIEIAIEIFHPVILG